jgi:hypothetical protein
MQVHGMSIENFMLRQVLQGSVFSLSEFNVLGAFGHHFAPHLMAFKKYSSNEPMSPVRQFPSDLSKAGMDPLLCEAMARKQAV